MAQVAERRHDERVLPAIDAVDFVPPAVAVARLEAEYFCSIILLVLGLGGVAVGAEAW